MRGIEQRSTWYKPKKTQQVILLSNENVGFHSNELEVVGEQWEPTMPFKDEVLVK